MVDRRMQFAPVAPASDTAQVQAQAQAQAHAPVARNHGNGAPEETPPSAKRPSSYSMGTQGNPGVQGSGSSHPRGEKRRLLRRKGALACDECRTRKRRCDGDLPSCGGCTKRTCPCIYPSDESNHVLQDSNLQESLFARRERAAAAARPSLPPPVKEKKAHRGSTSQDSPLSTKSDSCIGGICSAHNPNTGVGAHEHEPATIQAPDDTGLALNEVQGNEPAGSVVMMRPIQRAIDQISSHASISPTAVPGSSTSPAVARVARPRCTCNQILYRTKWCLPLRSQADALVNAYFRHFHRIYPIIHQQTFRRQYNKLWETTGTDENTAHGNTCVGLCRQRSHGKVFPAILDVIFAMGTLFSATSPEKSAARAEHFFLRSQQLDLFDVLNDMIGIEFIQLGLIMGFFLQSTERFSKCYNITGMTIRMAQNMGLQLSVDEARQRRLLTTPLTQLESEMRARVWYGCVVLDREISMSYGQRRMIPPAAQKPKLPESIDDEWLGEESGAWNNQTPATPSLVESYIQTIKLYDVLGQILDRDDLSFATQTEAITDAQELLNLDSILTEWRASLPDYLKHETSGNAGEDASLSVPEPGFRSHTDFAIQSTRLHGRFLHIRMLLLRPALVSIFQKLQDGQQSTSTASMQDKFQDYILSSTAAECVVSAQSLIDWLETNLSASSLPAWWHSICHLYTCGSVILMAQQCRLPSSCVLRRPLSESWDQCLKCLSRYAKFSSVAHKSLELLRASARILDRCQGTQNGVMFYFDGQTQNPPGKAVNNSIGGRSNDQGQPPFAGEHNSGQRRSFPGATSEGLSTNLTTTATSEPAVQTSVVRSLNEDRSGKHHFLEGETLDYGLDAPNLAPSDDLWMQNFASADFSLPHVPFFDLESWSFTADVL
ncbi:fungal-specific transcription factor domain-containing protein [Leptodontidium sp. MPI-SDFR-AT-0119]|nr:fungal-specific transcription factor domain-containing protein [Leptodontidium sp. MPI-SDFR-AT-0119]